MCSLSAFTWTLFHLGFEFTLGSISLQSKRFEILQGHKAKSFFYLKTSRFNYSEFFFFIFWARITSFWMLQKLKIFIANFYGLISLLEDFFFFFFEICWSKRKCLNNLLFLNILAVWIGSRTLKAVWRDWSGNV